MDDGTEPRLVVSVSDLADDFEWLRSSTNLSLDECRPNAKMDLFFVVHSRYSLKFGVWRDMTGLVNKILNHFRIGRNNVLAGAIRYHRDVDARGEVMFRQNQNKATLQRQIQNLRLGGWGELASIKLVNESQTNLLCISLIVCY